jgi:pimeloyl-ACP methyl ester carboxylesterase
VIATVNGLEERFTKHEGRQLRYLTGGSGPPLLLCHGFIGSAENFADWFDVLLSRRTIIAPDLPGFGRSAPMAGGHTVPALARAALSAVNDAGADHFDVAGLCLGSPIALAV